jgi:chromate transporter
MNEKQKLKEVAALFLKLGIIGFEVPLPTSLWCEEVVVKKVAWGTTLLRFNRTNLIPGPNEMAIHIGHERAGWKGLIVAGFCFIVPAVLTGIFAWLYKDYGQLPAIQPFLYGINQP